MPSENKEMSNFDFRCWMNSIDIIFLHIKKSNREFSKILKEGLGEFPPTRRDLYIHHFVYTNPLLAVFFSCIAGYLFKSSLSGSLGCPPLAV